MSLQTPEYAHPQFSYSPPVMYYDPVYTGFPQPYIPPQHMYHNRHGAPMAPHAYHHKQPNEAFHNKTVPGAKPMEESAPAPVPQTPVSAPVDVPVSAPVTDQQCDEGKTESSDKSQTEEVGGAGVVDDSGWSRGTMLAEGGAQSTAASDTETSAPLAPATPASPWKRGSTMAEKTAAHMLARDDGIIR